MNTNDVIKELERIDYFLDDLSGSRARVVVSNSTHVTSANLEIRLWSSCFEGSRRKDNDGKYTESIRDYALRMMKQKADVLYETIRLVKQEDQDTRSVVNDEITKP